MGSVVVADYCNTDAMAYSLEIGSGRVVGQKRSGVIEGLGQWKTSGIVGHRKRSFVAVFIRADSLVLWISGSEFDLLDPKFSAREIHRGILSRTVGLSMSGPMSMGLKYWHWRNGGWPDDGDIFSLVFRIVENPRSGRGFVGIWKSIRDGRDVGSKDFLRDVQGKIDRGEW
jgi:hypothetical protein